MEEYDNVIFEDSMLYDDDDLMQQQDSSFSDGESSSEYNSPKLLINHNMKELEEKFQALRKENLSLKFKIYFLEERLEVCNITPEQQENLFKKNKGLQEVVENMSRELEDSKTLLCAAARALEKADEKSAERELDLYRKLLQLHEHLEQEFDIPMEMIQGIDNVAIYSGTESTQSEEDALNQINKLRAENNTFIEMIQNCFRKIKHKFQTKIREGDERIAELKSKVNQIGKLETTLSTISQECREISDVLEEKNKKIKDLDIELNRAKNYIVHGDGEVPRKTMSLDRKHKDVERIREMSLVLESLHSHHCVIDEVERRKMKYLLEEVLKLSSADEKLDTVLLKMLNKFCSKTNSSKNNNIMSQNCDIVKEALENIIENQYIEDDDSESPRQWGFDLIPDVNSLGDRQPLSMLEYTRLMEISNDYKSESENSYTDGNRVPAKKICLCDRVSLGDERIVNATDTRLSRSAGGIGRHHYKDIKASNSERLHRFPKDDSIRRLKTAHARIKKISCKEDKFHRDNNLCCALMSFILSYTHFLMKR